jgi:hypothetical protein
MQEARTGAKLDRKAWRTKVQNGYQSRKRNSEKKNESNELIGGKIAGHPLIQIAGGMVFGNIGCRNVHVRDLRSL